MYLVKNGEGREFVTHRFTEHEQLNAKLPLWKNHIFQDLHTGEVEVDPGEPVEVHYYYNLPKSKFQWLQMKLRKALNAIN